MWAEWGPVLAGGVAWVDLGPSSRTRAPPCSEATEPLDGEGERVAWGHHG